MAGMTLHDPNRFIHKVGGSLVYFEISDRDDDAEPKYYGYLDGSGAWLIQCFSSNGYRYAVGSGDYAANWAARESKSYTYYDQVGV